MSRMFTAALFTAAPNWKLPSASQLLWCVHTMESEQSTTTHNMNKSHNHTREQKKHSHRAQYNEYLHLVKVQKPEKLLYDFRNSGYLWGDQKETWYNGGGALGCRSHVLFLDLDAGFTGVFSLWKFVELYNYDLHTFLYVYCMPTKKVVCVCVFLSVFLKVWLLTLQGIWKLLHLNRNPNIRFYLDRKKAGLVSLWRECP